jgi:hypothetical protein
VTSDGRWLWVLESYEPIVSRLDLATGGCEEVIRLPGTVPDGIAFTDGGGALIACYRPDRIYHLDRAGRAEIVAEDPRGTLLSAPTNVCFTGPELDRVGRGQPRPVAPHAARPRAARGAAAPPGALGPRPGGGGGVVAAGHGMGRRARVSGRPLEDPPARFVPRYYEIEQALRARVAALRPDDPLPSDAMLCEEFGVSRMTARNAVQRLAQEGLVYRVPGRGTFVAEPPVHRQAGSLLSFTEEMRRRGRVPSSRVLAVGVREPGPPRRHGSSWDRRPSWSPSGACASPTRSRWPSRRRSCPPPSPR